MKRVHKWWRRLVVFFSKLTKFRRGDPPEGIEEDLCEVVGVLHSIFRVICELQIPGVRLTKDQWELVYLQSTFVNRQARLVLANMNREGCELLVRELNGMYSAFH